MVADIRGINTLVKYSAKLGTIVLGGGISKHYINRAALCNNRGADYAVYINVADEFDGSDTGASPEEAVGCGKIAVDAERVKIFGDVGIILPLLFD